MSHQHLLRRDPTVTARAPSRFWPIVCVSLLVGCGVAVQTRYSFVPVNDAIIARGDRWTGEIVYVNFVGREVGRYPSFDPIRDGQAYQLRKP